MSVDVTIDDDKVHAFGNLMRQQMDLGDIQARKSLIRSVVSAITVSDNRICIIGDKARLTTAVLGANTVNGFVRSSVREWRALRESNPCFRRERATS